MKININIGNIIITNNMVCCFMLFSSLFYNFYCSLIYCLRYSVDVLLVYARILS